jgi:hypothetical protein
LFPAFIGVNPAQAAIGSTSTGYGQGPTYNGTPDSQVTHDFTYNGVPAPQYYFGLTNSPSQPRSKGGYLLITAGPDRKFLTADDSINGSRAQ